MVWLMRVTWRALADVVRLSETRPGFSASCSQPCEMYMPGGLVGAGTCFLCCVCRSHYIPHLEKLQIQ